VRAPSPTQRAPHGGDDPLLGGLVEIGVHGQADHFLGQPFAHRRAAGGEREVLVRLLAVQRGRGMDRGWDVLGPWGRPPAHAPAAASGGPAAGGIVFGPQPGVEPGGGLEAFAPRAGPAEWRRAMRSRAKISSGKIFNFSISTAAWIVSSRPFMPMRTQSYLPPRPSPAPR